MAIREKLASLEASWLTETSKILRKDGQSHKLNTVKDIDNGYIADYIAYNRNFNHLFAFQPGAFRINDIWLSIPPEQIAVQQSNGTLDLPVLRAKGGIKVDSGMTEVVVMLKVFFSDMTMTDGYKDENGTLKGASPTLESELMFKAMPLIEQLRTMPFCHVENEFLRKKITDVMFQGNKVLPDIDGKTSNPIDEDIMLTYVAHRFMVTPESPRIVELDLTFLLFNYHPFMHRVLYPQKWELNGNITEFKRDAFDMLQSSNFIGIPNLSLPFYQFHAIRLNKAASRASGYKGYRQAVSTGNQDGHPVLFDLSYYDYFTLPTAYISDEAKAKIDAYQKDNSKAPVFNAIPTSRNGFEDKYDFNADPILPVRFSKYSNGKLPDNELQPLTKQPTFRLAKDPANAWDKMEDQFYEYFNKVIPISGPRSAYRTLAEQFDIKNEAVNKSKAAEPGTSHHGWGYSVDINTGATALTDLQYQWLVENSPVYGFVRNARYRKDGKLIPENWHFTFISADYLAKNPPKPVVQPSNPDMVLVPEEKVEITKSDPNKTLGEGNSTKEVDDFVKKLLELKDIVFIKPDGKSNTHVYVKVPRKLPIFADRGLVFNLVEVNGGHDIPRIPLGGYNVATHQYMGGYTSKVTMHFTSSGTKEADEELQKIQAVMNKVSRNAKQLRSIAGFDGAQIKDAGFLNGLCGIDRLVFDNIEIVSHPEIPGGSSISIECTDFTDMYEKARAALDFDKNESENYKKADNKIATSVQASLLDRLLSYGPVFNVQHVIGIDENYKAYFSLWISDFTLETENNEAKEILASLIKYLNAHGKALFVNGFNLRVKYDGFRELRDNIGEIQFPLEDVNLGFYPSILRSSDVKFPALNSGNIVSVEPFKIMNSFGLKINIKNAVIFKKYDDGLFDYSIDWNTDFLSAKDISNSKYETLYHLFRAQKIGKAILASGPINSSFFFTGPGNQSREISQDLNEAIRAWIDENLDMLRKLQPTKPQTNTATEDFQKYGRTITTPAYPDFDLPPSLDPDFYFFSPYKHFKNLEDEYGNPTRTREDMATKELVDRYKVYSDHLTKGTKDGEIPFASLMSDTMSLDKGYSNAAEGQYSDQLSANVKSRDGEEEVAYVQTDPSKNPHPKSDADPSVVASNSSYSSNVEVTHVGNAGPNDIQAKTDIKIAETFDKKSYNDLSKNTVSPTGKYGLLAYADTGDGASIEFLEESFKRENAMKTPAIDFMKAFPTYKILIVEEDETEFLYPFVDDFNDYFGLNAVQEIRLVQHADQPSDVLVVRFVDLTGKYSSEKFKRYGGQEDKDPKKIDINENPLKGLILTEGTSIQLRAGYTNDVNKLPVLFNGKIVSIEGETEFTMVCQSYGYELVAAIKYPGGSSEDITTFNAETKEILSWCLDQPEVKHFGRWKADSISNLQASNSTDGLSWGLTALPRYEKIRPDGKISLTWTWVKNQAEFNVVMPEESIWAGLNQLTSNIADDWLGSAVNVLKIWRWPQYIFSSWYTSYYVQNQTLWEVIDEMTLRYPGTVAKVLPFGDRNTLYVGYPDGPYFHRELTIRESSSILELNREREPHLKELNELIAKLRERSREIEGGTGASSDAQRMSQAAVAASNILNSALVAIGLKEQEESTESIRSQIKTKENILAQIEASKMETRNSSVKIFRNYHRFSSHTNLIKSNITADSKDVHTEIILGFNPDYKGGDFDDTSKTITMKMNDMLEEEDVRSAFLEYRNCNSYEMAYKYAAEILRREAKKLYKGSLITIGMPEVKPMDIAFMFDHPNQIFGPVEIKRHVLTIAPGEGMISDFEPAMLVSIRNIITMAKAEALDVMAGSEEYYERYSSYDTIFGRGEDSAYDKLVWGIGKDSKSEEYDSKGIKHLLGSTQGQTDQISILNALSVGLPAASGTAIIAGAFGLGFIASGAVILALPAGLIAAHLAHKVYYASKYRNPIILHPLTRMGVPYIYGLSTYRTLGLLAWHQEKLKVLVSDIESAAKFAEKAQKSNNELVRAAAGLFLTANDVTLAMSKASQWVFSK